MSRPGYFGSREGWRFNSRPAKRATKLGRQDPHEPGENDEVGRVPVEQVAERAVVDGALGPARGRQIFRRDAGGARALEPARRCAIAQDERDLARDLARCDGVDQGLEVGAFARDQHGDALTRAAHDPGACPERGMASAS